MEVKQYATKQPTDHWWNKRGNKYLETNENESASIQNPWATAKAVLKGDHSHTILPQETRKISNNLALYLKQLQKEEQTKPKVGRRKEIIKIHYIEGNRDKNDYQFFIRKKVSQKTSVESKQICK